MPVLAAVDRSGATVSAVLPVVNADALREVLEPVMDKDALLVSDGGTIYPPCAAAMGVSHERLNQSSGKRVRGELHVQTVNNRHSLMAHPSGDHPLVVQPDTTAPVELDSYAGHLRVEWAPDEAITPLGQLPFFIDYLKQAGLFDAFVADSPLRYKSPNAPKVRDILGTLVLAVVTGARRYAHINSLRHDAINPDLLGMTRTCSDDSVLRAMGCLDGQKAQDWLQRHLGFAPRPVLREPWDPRHR